MGTIPMVICIGRRKSKPTQYEYFQKSDFIRYVLEHVVKGEERQMGAVCSKSFSTLVRKCQNKDVLSTLNIWIYKTIVSLYG